MTKYLHIKKCIQMFVQSLHKIQFVHIFMDMHSVNTIPIMRCMCNYALCKLVHDYYLTQPSLAQKAPKQKLFPEHLHNQ